MTSGYSNKFLGNQVWKAVIGIPPNSRSLLLVSKVSVLWIAMNAEHCCSILRDERLGSPWADIWRSGLNQAWDVEGTNQHPSRGQEESMVLNFWKENKEATAALVGCLALWKCTWSIWEAYPVLPMAFNEVQGTQSSAWTPWCFREFFVILYARTWWTGLAYLGQVISKCCLRSQRTLMVLLQSSKSHRSISVQRDSSARWAAEPRMFSFTKESLGQDFFSF